MSIHKLGRVRGHRKYGLPHMGAFLRSVQLPALPAAQDWYSSISSWGELLNNSLSDCTIATVGHIVLQESTYASTAPLLMTDAEALAGYEAATGYNPTDPSTDQGAYEGDIGAHWLHQGFQCGGEIDKIVGFADVDVRNLADVKYSIFLTGNAFLGVSLPACAESGSTWEMPTTTAGAKILGGHAIPAVGYDENWIYVVSWGQLIPVSWAFFQAYCDEVHVTLSHRWQHSTGLTPAGFDWSTLIAATRTFSSAT